jgi:hypothetical protein
MMPFLDWDFAEKAIMREARECEEIMAASLERKCKFPINREEQEKLGEMEDTMNRKEPRPLAQEKVTRHAPPPAPPKPGFHTDGHNPPLAQTNILRPTILPPAPPLGRTGARDIALEPITFTATAIMCCDCGVGLITTEYAKPKELAKSHGWEYAGKGNWRCAFCADNLGGMDI